MDENNPFLSVINSPVFSPDGQTLAYGYKGLNIYNISTGASDLVMENQIEDRGSGFLFPKELYWPERYSPDGSKLLITLGYYEGASAALDPPASWYG
jgi:Tol biopolymer transport system component